MRFGVATISILIIVHFAILAMVPGATQEVMAADTLIERSTELHEKGLFTFKFPDVDKYPVVTALAISSNGERIFTGGDDCCCAVWDVQSGELIKHFRAHEDWVRGLVLSPDGRTLVTAGQNGEIKLWNASDFTLKQTFNSEVLGARNLACSPSGKVLAVGGYKAMVYLFDLNSGRSLNQWNSAGPNTRAVVFSPDGTLLAAAGRNGTVRIWETQSGRILYNLQESSRRVNAVAFSPDGQQIAAAGEDDYITVWNVKTGQKVKKIPVDNGKIFSMIYCSADYLATGDSFNVVRIWKVSTAKEVAYGNGHTGTVAVMNYDSNKKELATGSFDTTVRYWDLEKVLAQ